MSFSAAFALWLRNPVDRCLLVEVGVKSGGGEITRYLSTTGYVTGAADTPANTVYHGYVSGGCAITRQLDLSGGGGSVTFGETEIDNTDHSRDSWVEDIWDGRPIAYYLGAKTWARADFVQVFAGTVSTIEAKSRTTLALHVHDILAPLADTFSTATVGGAGDNASALMAYCLGECFNVRPILLDAATQKYSPHNGAIEAVLETRDNAIVVPTTVTAASGYFTLTNARFGEICCDVQGAKVGGAYRNDAGGLIEWVATSLGNGNQLVAADFDATLLAAFRAACAQPVGRYVDERINRLALMQELAASVGATVTTTGAGKVQIVRLAFGSSVRTINEGSMVAGSFAPVATPAVQGAQRLAYGRNWNPGGANIAGSVTAAQIPILTDEYNFSESTDAAVLADYNQNATPSAVETLLVVQADADAETARRKALWNVQRVVYGWSGFAELLDVEIGETDTIVHTYFGMSGGVTGLIVGVTQDWFNLRAHLQALV